MSGTYGAIEYIQESLTNQFGMKEWDDPFNKTNIPRNLINKAFHIEVSDITAGAINQNHQDIFLPMDVSIYFSGYKKPGDARKDAIDKIDDIFMYICKASNRTTKTLNVVFDGATMEALNATNDNSVLVTMKFTAQLVFGVY